jgi:hypothetical protein
MRRLATIVLSIIDGAAISVIGGIIFCLCVYPGPDAPQRPPMTDAMFIWCCVAPAGAIAGGILGAVLTRRNRLARFVR